MFTTVAMVGRCVGSEALSRRLPRIGTGVAMRPKVYRWTWLRLVGYLAIGRNSRWGNHGRRVTNIPTGGCMIPSHHGRPRRLSANVGTPLVLSRLLLKEFASIKLHLHKRCFS